MSKKTAIILFVFATLAVALAIFGVPGASRPGQMVDDDAPREAAQLDSVGLQPPRPSSGTLGGVDAPRLELCGRITNYDPKHGRGFVTVSVALPGTAHPVQTGTISPEGRWKLSLVPGAPLTVAATVPGSPASSLRIAQPVPCSREVYEFALGTDRPTIIQGTVSDVFGGPIANAEIDVVPQGHQNGFGFEQPVFRTVSGDGGEFSITVPSNKYVVRSAFPGYSSAMTSANTTLREFEEVALVLSPGATVSGRVVHASDGKGVQSAELRLVELADADGPFANHAARADAISGPDGVFVIENVGFGSWAIYAKSGEAISSAPTEVSVELYDDLRDIVVSVDTGTPVYGVVRQRGSNEPVADALVLLNGDGLALTCSPSDSQGVFDCGPVAHGRYTAIVSHKQYAGNLLGANVSVGPEQRFIELELERGYTIAGRVSPPVAGVPIRVRMGIDAIGIGSMGFTMMNAFSAAETDADGYFTIGPVSLGEVTLVAEHREHGHGQVVVNQALAESGEEVQLVLSPAGTLIGQITNFGETNAASLELVLTPVDEPKRIDGVRPAGAPMYTVPVGESGAFQARGLEAGSYTLALRHSLGTVRFTGPEQVELQDGEHTRVGLALSAQQLRFSGVVVDETGGLVEGAVIYSAGDRSSRAVSDFSGEFTLVAWSDASTLAVRYHRAGYTTATSEASLRAGQPARLVVPTELDLHVTHPGVESGRLVITGKTRMERPIARAGTTTVAGLIAGSYQVHVCGDEAYGSGKVDLAAQQSTLSISADPWIEITGTAIGPEGEPLAGAQVFAMPISDPCGVLRRAAVASFAQGIQVTSDDGAFALSGLPPGPTLLYFVDTSTDSPRELSTTVDIAAGDERHELGEIRL